MEEIAERYRRRAADFGAKVAGVAPGDWERASPCAKWSARDVVGHIVEMHGFMLTPVGRSLGPVTVAEDPVVAFEQARAAVEAVLADAELANQEVDTPAGRLTAAANIDQVISDDLVLHGWDLARATGQDETMNPEDVERLWRSTTALPAELIEQFRTPGAFGPGEEVFGPEVPVAEDAPLQDRLLGFIGRTP
ncbi:uncharacterized protein (TIGR03086 family) [Kribbella amoyensis]|uniref:Uncharacterized protein (TIGR03086 family) n=1 Tax=Kribbella amoyensis TaxID=996641 RepID=A0A561BQZ0_9ACTN|nr:TIGR03086 family metal-binding protein [Kribbella amoyensis]TWD81274.1 uncharacterized protein (TIGR03086 family) [Kribbella amoyensis]